jgi:hypothetical protein
MKSVRVQRGMGAGGGRRAGGGEAGIHSNRIIPEELLAKL